MVAWRRHGGTSRRRPKGASPDVVAGRVLWRRLAPWPLVAIAAAVTSALAGWLICLAVCLAGWLSDTGQPLTAPMHLAASFFLLAHWVGVGVAGVSVSIVPLTLTLAIVASGVGVTRAALRHGFAAAPESTTTRVLSVTAVIAGTYAVILAVVARFTQPAGPDVRAIAGGLVIGGVIGWTSAAPLFGWRLDWAPVVPEWVRALPRAIGAGLGVLLAGGAFVLVVALLGSRDRVAELQAGLAPGTFGSVLLAIGQIFWLPNLVIWCAAWLVGAGFSIGAGTVVSPVAVEMGMLPSIPVFGAIPEAGAPSPMLLLWFAVPLAAGVAAAWVTLRAQTTHELATGETPRPDIGGLIGGATGIVTGLAATIVAALSRGDLGAVRLTGLGPRLDAMIFLAPTLLGVAGLVTGVVVGWRGSSTAGVPAPKPPTPARQPTPPRPPTPPKPPVQPRKPKA